MHFLRIILLCVVSAIVYGIIHDQITARVCLEYFTLGHPPLFRTDSPTLLGLGWGVVATWWMGLILGIALALAACVGPYPQLGAQALLKPVGVLLLCMGFLSLMAGVGGYWAARMGSVFLLPPMAERVPAPRHITFIADLWAHLMSYGSGFVGGLSLCAWAIIKRRRLHLIRGQGAMLLPDTQGTNTAK